MDNETTDATTESTKLYFQLVIKSRKHQQHCQQ